jgi:hypothetical protein
VDTKIERLNLKSKLLDYELQEFEELLVVASRQFREFLINIENEHGLKIIPEKPKKCCGGSCDIKVEKNKNKIDDPVMKSMYRDIARMVHPDINGNQENLTKIMVKASKAQEDQDISEMMNICESLGINTPSLDQAQIKLIESKIVEKEKRIEQIKKSDPWIWYHSDEHKRTEIKNMIVNRYKLAR